MSDYNLARIASGEITADDVRRLFTLAQKQLGLMADGLAGPVTLEKSRPKPVPLVLGDLTVVSGLLSGDSVIKMPAHFSWYGGALPTPGNAPLGIVVHTTDTNPGTARSMAARRARKFGLDPEADRMSSCHVWIDTDGTIISQVPLNCCAWHGGSGTARKIPGVGWANYSTIGIERVSPDDKNFPPAQVEAAKRVWRAIVKAYGIPREHAMIAHGSFEDPNVRVDPGPEWMGTHGPAVLAYAYA